ncbi:MAG: YhcH/YjgK/YiaL family protein, partial [Oscillospiraceae bacterium]|nr:YhcH/YjgK/YiaL family protein [Oscillospiraceae bacterium]
GEEAMAFEQAENLEPICEYNPEKDYILLKGASNKVILRPGDFVILYPGEAHRAALDAGNGGEVFRCNVRIRIKGE